MQVTVQWGWPFKRMTAQNAFYCTSFTIRGSLYYFPNKIQVLITVFYLLIRTFTGRSEIKYINIKNKYFTMLRQIDGLFKLHRISLINKIPF